MAWRWLRWDASAKVQLRAGLRYVGRRFSDNGEAFRIPGIPAHIWSGAAVLVLVVGLLIAVGAAIRWVRVERAMRTGRPLPLPALIPFLSGVAVLACTAVLAFVLS